MTGTDWQTLLGQLGMSGLFAGALLVVVKKFYDHLMDDQRYMRERISYLEAKLDKLESAVRSIQ